MSLPEIDAATRRWLLAEVEREEAQIRAQASPAFEPLDDELAVDDSLFVDVGSCLVDLDAAVQDLILDGGDLAAFNARLISREAVCSSHIEGEATHIGYFDVAEMILERNEPKSVLWGREPPTESEATVLRCATATRRLVHSRCSISAVREAHRRLMEGTEKKPGRFRGPKDLVWIMRKGEVSYVPPLGGPPISRMMNDLGEWVKTQLARLGELAPQHQRYALAVAVSGMAHLRFESIHPFVDGNGRTGRSFSEAIIAKARPAAHLRAPVGIASAFSYGDRRQSYYQALREHREDPPEFAKWWAQQVMVAAGTALKIINNSTTAERG